MYNMDDKAVNDLAKGLDNIVRNARTIIVNPEDNHNRLEDIISVAQLQLKNLKLGKYRTKATQRMAKPRLDKPNKKLWTI
jgi:hypothetical protein